MPSPTVFPQGISVMSNDNQNGVLMTSGEITIIDGKKMAVVLYTPGNAGGAIEIYNVGQDKHITIDGATQTISSSSVRAALLESNVAILGGGVGLNVGGGILQVRNAANNQFIQLNGETQTISCFDVQLSNADCAEEFDLQEGDTIDAGSVVILTHKGAVTECREEYDTRVAGVISGAGCYKPGIILDRKNATAGRVPVTLMGKAFCKIDATKAPIWPGGFWANALGYRQPPLDSTFRCSLARPPVRNNVARYTNAAANRSMRSED